MLGIVFWGGVFGKLVFWVSLESLCSRVSLESSRQKYGCMRLGYFGSMISAGLVVQKFFLNV
jgi:hypothetical protein